MTSQTTTTQASLDDELCALAARQDILYVRLYRASGQASIAILDSLDETEARMAAIQAELARTDA